MSSKTMNQVVERLLVDRRFLSRFRDDSDGAMARYSLTRAESEAVKSGDQRRLLDLGLDRKFVEPTPRPRSWWASFALRSAAILSVPALVAILLTASPSIALASPGRRTAGVRLGRVLERRTTGVRRAENRVKAAATRFGSDAPKGLTRSAEQLDPEGQPTGIDNAISRVRDCAGGCIKNP